MDKRRLLAGSMASVGMVLLILDANTAIGGARDGVLLCMNTLVPSLFPFILLSVLICGNLAGTSFRFLRPLGKLCGIPAGSESLLLLSFAGGYPVGAQSVGDAYSTGQLSRQNALRMLGFCNNAGPAFIFGMIASAFAEKAVPWVIWGIHILSAVLTALILPRSETGRFHNRPQRNIGISEALKKSIRSMGLICGWVVVFRVILAVCGRWFFWLLPQSFQVLLTGLLELANGCAVLHTIPSDSLRFLLACCLLNFGGLCVGMQTVAVTGSLGTGQYFPGKLLQGTISCLLAMAAQGFLFPAEENAYPAVLWVASVILLIAEILCVRGFRRAKKKVVAFSA